VVGADGKGTSLYCDRISRKSNHSPPPHPPLHSQNDVPPPHRQHWQQHRHAPREGACAAPRAPNDASILVPPVREPFPPSHFTSSPHPSPAASLPQVAAPPGGATSWSLGWGSEPAPPSNNRRGAQAQAAYAAAPSVNPYAAAGAEAAPVAAAYGAPAYPSAAPAAIKENTSALPAPRVGVSANVFANGANQNAGENGGDFFPCSGGSGLGVVTTPLRAGRGRSAYASPAVGRGR
jgi:hypothetical protein